MSEIIGKTDYYAKVNVAKVALIDINTSLEKVITTLDPAFFSKQLAELREIRGWLRDIEFEKWEDLTD